MSRDYLFRYFYRWVSTMKNAHICHDKNIVCFCNDKYHAHIIFYKEFNMMELSIEDKWTEKNVFYLHFEMMDILSTRKTIIKAINNIILSVSKHDLLIIKIPLICDP